MCELLWSDPQPAKGRAPSKRGVGVAFGPDVTKAFLDLNKLDLLVGGDLGGSLGGGVGGSAAWGRAWEARGSRSWGQRLAR